MDTPNHSRDPWHSSPAGLAVFGFVYALAAHLSLGTIGVPGVRIEGWLPLGVYLAWLLRLPRSSWWKVIATSAAATLVGFSWAREGVSATAQVGFWVVDTAGVLVGARLWGGVFNPDRDLQDFRGIGRLVRSCLATASFTVVAAVVGTVLGGFDAPAWSTATGFVVGTLLGMLFAAPPVLLASRKEVRLMLGDRARRAEFLVGILLLAAWILAGAEALHGSRPGQERFLIMPFALWAAWRQGRLATAIVLLLGHVLDGAEAAFTFEGFSFGWALRALVDEVFLILLSLGLAVGISSLRRARDELERVAVVAERTGVSILTADTSGRITWANRAFSANTGYASDEILGRKPGELLLGPETDASAIARMRDAVRSGKPFSETVLNYRKDRSTFWHRIDVDPLRDEHGGLRGFIGVQTDVSELVKARETRALAEAAAALKEETERFRLVAEGTRDLIWDWDLRTNRQWWNEAYHAFWGSDPAAFRPTFEEWMARVHPGDRERVMATYVAFRDDPARRAYEQTLRLLSRDGSWRTFRDRCYGLRAPDGTLVRMAGAMEDITDERSEAERALVNAKLEATGVLAAGIAHDFNNLLTTLLLGVDTLSRPPSSVPAGQREVAAHAAREAVITAKGLTDRLLTFAEGGASVRRDLDLALLVRQAAAAAAPEGRLVLELVLPPELPRVHGDEGQLGQVVRNLVLNAAEAMPGGGTLRIEATALPAPELSVPGFVRLRFADTGPGLSPEVARRAFDPYFTTKPPGHHKGLGLGLTICRSIVQKHGGTIDLVPSPTGHGAVFEILLPVRGAPARIPAAPIPATAKAAPTAPPATGQRDAAGLRVLVLEDEPLLLGSLGTILRSAGHQPVLVDEGHRAVEAFREAHESGRPFDVVLLDLVVRGGMGGEEAIGQLRALDPGVRAVVMSGYARAGVLADPAAHGFAAALAKPFAARDLRAAIDAALAAPRGGAGTDGRARTDRGE